MNQNKKQLIEPTAPDTALVFGLSWRTLVGTNLEARSRNEAIKEKATHYVKAREQSPSFGVMNAPAEKKSKRRLYSAASIFAQSKPHGVFYRTLAVSDGEIWVVASQDGSVISGTDIICDPEEAEEIVDSLRQRHPKIVLSEDDDDDPAFYMNEKTQIIQANTLLESIPPWVRYAACGVLILIVADMSWTQYKKHKAAEQARLDMEQQFDARNEWLSAINEWESQVTVGGRQDLLVIYEAIKNLPMSLGGWSLSAVKCTATEQAWLCRAAYARKKSGTNISLKSAAPGDWQVQFDSINDALISWTPPASRKKLTRKNLFTKSEIMIHYVSLLQAVLPSVSSYKLSSPEPVSIKHPVVTRKNGEKVEVPYPDENTKGIEIPSIQRFALEAPLRSLSIIPLIEDTKISSVEVSVKHDFTGQSLNKSMFMAKLEGEIYVR